VHARTRRQLLRHVEANSEDKAEADALSASLDHLITQAHRQLSLPNTPSQSECPAREPRARCHWR
jgi:hypothetical protein